MRKKFEPLKQAMKIALLLLAVFFLSSSPASVFAEPLTFALVPKQVNNSFFDLARDGCVNRAANIPEDVTCLYVGPLVEGDAQAQADIIDDLIACSR